MKRKRGAAWLAAGCVLGPPAHAALWSVDPSVEISGGANSNYGLSVERDDRVVTLATTGAVSASRRTENTESRADVRVTGLALRGDLPRNELQDHVTLSQTLTGPIDSFALTVDFLRDDTLQAPTSSSDLLLGRGLQRTSTANASWTRRLTERLSVTSMLGVERTRYSHALAAARDYQNGSASAAVEYLVDERSSVNARAGHQDYRALDDSVRSMTDDFTLGMSRALSETSQLSASLGRYRVQTSAPQVVLVCPEEASLCAGGLVSPIAVVRAGRTTQWGLQYDATWSAALGERTKTALSAARRQSPSGAGVTVRDDTLKASLDRALTPTLDGAVSFTRSSSVYQGLTAGPQPRLQTLDLLLKRSLSPRLTLRANADVMRSDEPITGRTARSTSFSVTLRYDWQQLDARP